MANEFKARNGVIAPKLEIGTSESWLSDVSEVECWRHSKNFSVSAQESEPRDISFDSAGTRMYILGNAGDDITQYTLSSAWDIATAASPVTFSVATQETTPYGMFFRPDGTSVYVVGETNDTVYRYNLSTAWNIATASFVNSFSVAAQEAAPQSIYFSSDGTKMYVCGSTGDDVNQYNLGTAWDITTAVYSTVFSVSAYENAPQGISFNSTGTKMYICGSTSATVVEYNLGTAWSISTAVFSSQTSVFNLDIYELTGLSGIYLSESQNKAWVVCYGTDRVYELNTSNSSLKIYGSRLVSNASVSLNNNLNILGNVRAQKNINVLNTLNASTVASNTFTSTNTSGTYGLNTNMTTGTMNVFGGQTTGIFNLGATAATGNLNLGISTAAQTVGIANGATASATTKTVNIGTGGLSGSTTSIVLGSSVSGASSSTTIYGSLNTVGGIKNGTESYPSYKSNIEYTTEAAGTWKTLITVNSPLGTYVTIGFIIKVTDCNTNHATTGSVDSIDYETYIVACVRTNDTVQDTPDACYVRGPNDRIRAVKTSTGNYEVQIQNEAQYREYLVSIEVYAVNQAHTVVYSGGTTAAAGTAQYTATSGTSTDWFQNTRTKGVIGVSEAAGTGNRLLISSSTSGGVINQNHASSLLFQTQGVTRFTVDNSGNATATGQLNGASALVSQTAGRVQLATDSGGSISLGRVDNNATSPYLDFNSGATSVDFDSRITASGGTGTAGNGNLTATTAGLTLFRSVSTQDGITFQPRNGGTNSRRTTITNATLTADRTITTPDASGTLAFIGDAQTFTANGTWTKPPNCTFVFVRVIGGGGGGGGGLSGGTPTTSSASGGGGSGCMEYLYLASALPSTVSVTIGAGGAGGAANTAGGDGTGTTFGTYLRSGRGLGGQIPAGGNGVGTSSSMAIISSATATTLDQFSTMMLSMGSAGRGGTGSTTSSRFSAGSARDCYNSCAGGGGGGFDATNLYGGYGGAGFWITLSTSVDLISGLGSSVRNTGTPIGNGAAPGAANGDAGNTATRTGDGGGGGNYGTVTGGAGGAGFRGGGGGGGGNGGTTGGAGGAGGAGYCEVYSW